MFDFEEIKEALSFSEVQNFSPLSDCVCFQVLGIMEVCHFKFHAGL